MAPHERAQEDRIERALDSVNSGYVAELYEQYRRDPASVDAEWRNLFASGAAGFEPAPSAASAANGNGSAPSAAPAPTPAPPPASPATPTSNLPEGATPIKGPAARLASNMIASLAIPTATSYRDLNVAVLEARRREINASIAPRKVSFTHLIGWAIVQAAAEQRAMTHYYTERDGQAYRVDPGAVNLGLAVDVERSDGSRFLVVPVIKQADDMDFGQFLDRYEELVGKARGNKLAPDDFAGATITLTNPGTLGTSASVPRLMPNQGTIVATGTIRQVGEQRVMTISSTYDHRIIQGAESGAFLGRIDRALSGEGAFYEDVFATLGSTAQASTAGAQPAAAPVAAQAAAASAQGEPASMDDLKAVAAGMALVKAYRNFGHAAAQLDPLGGEPRGDPSLDPGPLGLNEQNMARIPAELMRIYVPGATLAEALPHLRETYCGTISYEVEHIASHEERVWLRQVIESGQHRQPLTPDEQKQLLHRLTQVETLERFLHKAYLGQKRFSIEGVDSLVPMLDRVVHDASANGTRQVVIGMAHRGRLNVLAHIVGISYEAVLSEFEAGRAGTDSKAQAGGLADDVKYHLGASGSYQTPQGTVQIEVAPNPSHLEAVNPVVEGATRARQTDRTTSVVQVDPKRTLPVLIHGDASFAAQGVVAETFNLGRLAGYSTGGTIHVIANNQIGFTTGPSEGRSTDYSSDLAKGFDAPIVHVNADDPEACLAAVRLAMLYREKFHNDVVIDLVGYRKYGHNEGDEPAYTQPAMYRKIDEHPSVRELYLGQLIEAGVVSKTDADAAQKAFNRDLAARQNALRNGPVEEDGLDRGDDAISAERVAEPETAVAGTELERLNAQLYSWPAEFHVNPKLAKQLERHRAALTDDVAHIDWAQGEALAFASLRVAGVPIRLTGQDTVRGTFSQRHQALHDAETGQTYLPIQHIDGASAGFEVHNSPLSEYACLGFEYGYAVTAPEALVLWEAQYGDFVNGAEIIIDQFLIAGLAKWRQTSRLTLLLPHGYEGSGPEHSSARIERFMSLAAEGNIRIAYPTTPGQYFHLLRRQALIDELRPLIVFTPKSLLRLPAAASRLSDLATGRFEPVLDDPTIATGRAASAVRRVVVCSGKVYYDLLAARKDERPDVAIVRVERLYPFPADELRTVLSRYGKTQRVVWVQEEPRNMGPRKFVMPKIRQLVPREIKLEDVSRPERSRPAEGYPAAHAVEQARIVREALG
ncbi:MAG TPA: multifunctional oxoglutarate decarboxylase/oxoglutarate dehydrogenase thiamine pyrophosphate-binding subunit/dihydrolipoyllysine-residue succinyltransferase subunit [Candidatus Limnocylindria bacterium]|nr:multifunctional oxoglutarate decarboxylase/oxoglutarate dehydrogenase thiamine pyrophosphate-binding subunit/dihydrolipoyllysine-residue succinyltransferase subunit [Candidatus Limnocylindria bacterium]